MVLAKISRSTLAEVSALFSKSSIMGSSVKLYFNIFSFANWKFFLTFLKCLMSLILFNS